MSDEKKSGHKHQGHADPPTNDTANDQTDNDISADTTQSPWQYSQKTDGEVIQPPSIKPISWTASEFVDHEKDAGWFLVLGVITIIADGIIYLATQDIATCILVIVGAILFGVMANRKPRTLEYKIDSSGVTIGDKLYPHAHFKSFTIMRDGAFSSIQLVSLKRFMPPISLYCPPDQEAAVVEALAVFLPHEQRATDPIDTLMHKIRF